VAKEEALMITKDVVAFTLFWCSRGVSWYGIISLLAVSYPGVGTDSMKIRLTQDKHNGICQNDYSFSFLENGIFYPYRVDKYIQLLLGIKSTDEVKKLTKDEKAKLEEVEEDAYRDIMARADKAWMEDEPSNLRPKLLTERQIQTKWEHARVLFWLSRGMSRSGATKLLQCRFERKRLRPTLANTNKIIAKHNMEAGGELGLWFYDDGVFWPQFVDRYIQHFMDDIDRRWLEKVRTLTNSERDIMRKENYREAIRENADRSFEGNQTVAAHDGRKDNNPTVREYIAKEGDDSASRGDSIPRRYHPQGRRHFGSGSHHDSIRTSTTQLSGGIFTEPLPPSQPLQNLTQGRGQTYGGRGFNSSTGRTPISRGFNIFQPQSTSTTTPSQAQIGYSSQNFGNIAAQYGPSGTPAFRQLQYDSRDYGYPPARQGLTEPPYRQYNDPPPDYRYSTAQQEAIDPTSFEPGDYMARTYGRTDTFPYYPPSALPYQGFGSTAGPTFVTPPLAQHSAFETAEETSARMAREWGHTAPQRNPERGSGGGGSNTRDNGGKKRENDKKSRRW